MVKYRYFKRINNEGYLKFATLVSNKLNKKITTISCARNKFCDTWWNGKKYSILI